MTKESIKTLLETMCQYNNVRITQIFTKGSTDWISVKCQPHTNTLVFTYLLTGSVEYYESIDEAVQVIETTLSTQETA